MLKIRLKRIGKKGQAFFRVVVIDSASKRDGRSVADLGSYNPHVKESVNIDLEMAKAWMEKGAQPSETVSQYFVKLGILKAGKKGSVQSKGRAKKKEAQA
jgi:small subunit ribosomal protein S16